MRQVESLADHQRRLENKAEEILGDAISLKIKLKNAVSVPFPDRETDALIAALAVFQAAVERCAR